MSSLPRLIFVSIFLSVALTGCSEEQRLRPTRDYAETRMRTATAETERHSRKAKQLSEETGKASAEIAQIANELHSAGLAAGAQAEVCETKARNAGAKLAPVRH